MSRFSGRQGKGAARRARDLRRDEAEMRQEVSREASAAGHLLVAIFGPESPSTEEGES